MRERIKALRDERARLWDEQRAVLDGAAADERDLSAEERATFDKMESRMNELAADVERLERHLAAEPATPVSVASRVNTDSGDDPADGAPVFRNALDKWIRHDNLTPEEIRVLGVRGDRIRFPEFRVQPTREMRQQSTATAGAGGNVVADEAMRPLQEAMLAFGGMRQVATVLSTSTGADLPIPTVDSTGNVGAILGENTEETTTTDETFGQTVLQAYKYSSRFVKASMEFIQDASIDAAAWLASRLGERIGRITNTHFTTGTGSSQPLGIINSVPIGINTASVSAVTRNEIIDLIHSVDPAYRPRARFMMNDATIAAIKKLTVGSGDDRPLWQPGIAVGEPDRLEGYPYTINQDVASQAADARFMLFGDLSAYHIRDVMGIDIRRLDERYVEFGQVAWIAFSRHDGAPVLPATGANAPYKVMRAPAS